MSTRLLSSPIRSTTTGEAIATVLTVLYDNVINALHSPHSCSILSDYVLRAMPVITEDYAALASKITVAFTGDPSFFAYNGEEEEPEPEDPDAPPVERFRELHRLVYVIKVSLRCNVVHEPASHSPTCLVCVSCRKLITNAL